MAGFAVVASPVAGGGATGGAGVLGDVFTAAAPRAPARADAAGALALPAFAEAVFREGDVGADAVGVGTFEAACLSPVRRLDAGAFGAAVPEVAVFGAAIFAAGLVAAFAAGLAGGVLAGGVLPDEVLPDKALPDKALPEGILAEVALAAVAFAAAGLVAVGVAADVAATCRDLPAALGLDGASLGSTEPGAEALPAALPAALAGARLAADAFTDLDAAAGFAPAVSFAGGASGVWGAGSEATGGIAGLGIEGLAGILLVRRLLTACPRG
ncbi:hypothetical protein [Ancylobacter moscoviensis]